MSKESIFPDGFVWGTVRWFDDSKGYGFIMHPEGDVFAHYSVIRQDGHRTLEEREVLAYSWHSGGNGLRADAIYRRAELEALGVDAPYVLTGDQEGAPVEG